MTNSAPIGVFDSGIGGLTVAAAIRATLPSESLIYFGDTARVPYGPKSPDTVRRYARQIAEWLVEQGVKAVVVACNTATAHALNELTSSISVPVIGVINPGARAAASTSRNSQIAVIGTAGTIGSGAYERAIHSFKIDASVHSVSCPLFVPLVEEGWVDHPATRLIAAEYLRDLGSANVDTLVLGCTHYPLLSAVIAETMGSAVKLIDSAKETAIELKNVLEAASLTAAASNNGNVRFVASDDPQHFLKIGRRFLGDAMSSVEQVTFT